MIWRLRTSLRAMHGDQVAIEYAGVLHAHAHDLQQVVRPRLEQPRVDAQVIDDVFLGQDRPAGRHAADQRQAQLLAQIVAQADAARGAGNQLDAALALQRAQVFLGRIGRTETELLGDFRTRGRHAGFGEALADHVQDLRLARR